MLLQSEQKQVPFFSKYETSFVKGIALIMMFFHHFFTFPERWIEGINYLIMSVLSPYLCQPSKLCVPVFSFLTGYFYFFSKYKTLKYSIRKITDLLVNYWLAYVVLALIAVFTVQHSYNLIDVLKEMFAVYTPTMRFCWYVCYYYLLMLFLPVYAKMHSEGGIVSDLAVIILIPFAINTVSSYVSNEIIGQILTDISWLPTALIGYVFAAYNMFGCLDKLLLRTIDRNWIVTTLLITGLIVPFIGRVLEPQIGISFAWPSKTLDINLDILYAPIFVYSLVKLRDMIRNKIAKSNSIFIVDRAIRSIGTYSMFMWFFHCIYFNMCANLFQPVLYFPKIPILVLIWGLAISWPVAFILDVFAKKLLGLKNKAFLETVKTHC